MLVHVQVRALTRQSCQRWRRDWWHHLLLLTARASLRQRRTCLLVSLGHPAELCLRWGYPW